MFDRDIWVKREGDVWAKKVFGPIMEAPLPISNQNISLIENCYQHQ